MSDLFDIYPDRFAERCYLPECEDGWVSGASDYCSLECEQLAEQGEDPTWLAVGGDPLSGTPWAEKKENSK